MKPEDTVMGSKEIIKSINDGRLGNKRDGRDGVLVSTAPEYMRDHNYACKAQAEISFKAGMEEESTQAYHAGLYDGKLRGIREVVEWIQLNSTDAIAIKDSDTQQEMTIRAIPDDNWQAQKKVWGIGEGKWELKIQ